MKKCLLIFVFALGFLKLTAQSNFDPEAFMQYREQIKGMSAGELLQKYKAEEDYYSYRTNPTPLNSFQYLDSIEMKFGLSDHEKSMLQHNHFMVTERMAQMSFTDALVRVYSSDLPLFFSSDIVLHALHASYDEMLKTMEIQMLEPNLKLLLEGMLDEIPDLFASWSAIPELKQAVKDADLFLSVALSLLLDEDVEPGFDDSGNFPLLMIAIREQTQPILNLDLFSEKPRRLDVSQFIPRGHYTQKFWTQEGQRDLSQYFRSMMWLGRVDFMLTPPPVEPGGMPWSEEDILRMNLGALAVNYLLDESGERSLFELHEKTIGFFVGPDDNLNPDELKGILLETGLEPGDLLLKENFDTFQSKLRESDDYGQKIMSNFFIVDADKENPAELPISYRLLGQKFLIDSYVFSEVVYDRVYKDGIEVKRMMPDPLDALFVLGNNNTLPLLREELEEYHYAYKLEELRYLTEAYDRDFWDQSLYNTWLDGIRKLNPAPSTDNLPYFMQTSAWQMKNMNTQLASWTELRHDNVLYAKQSYTGGTSCSFPHVFVEPVPELYFKLSQFAESALVFFSNELSGRDIQAVPDIIHYYERFGEHMRKLGALAQKELERKNFSESEITYLKTMINSFMASGPTLTGWYAELFYEPYRGLMEDFLVVDVHTQPTNETGDIIGKIMHVGTGKINMGVFCTGSPSNDYAPVAYMGPVFSFHQHFEYNFKRLTDDEWALKFWTGEEVPQADWAGQFLAGPEGKPLVQSRNLPGVAFTGTSIDNTHNSEGISYMLAFPNPAERSTKLRFILNKEEKVFVEVFNATGQQVRKIQFEQYGNGEHEIELSLENIPAGIYHVRLRAGNDSKTTRLFVVE